MTITETNSQPVPGPAPQPTESSDARLVSQVGDVLAVPRQDQADSFVLHAPLELVARAALLPYVAPAHRAAARRRIEAIADEFEAFGPPVPDPEPTEYDSVDDAAVQLVAAIDRGELDDVDAAARWLGRAGSATELPTLLATDIVSRLAAAAHAPIFLYQLPRIAPRGEVTGELLRGLARELGRAPDWRLHWIDERGDGPPAGAAAMFDAIASTPFGSRGDGPTPFIFPLMASVDEPGIAAAQLRDVTHGWAIRDRAQAVLRAAAWSMLLEPDDHAPYGWSHCLTMPQAVLGLAPGAVDPSTALAVAATYVVGFRSALARCPLEPVFAPDDPGVPLAEALAAAPDVAAAAAWHLPATAFPDLVAEVATRASIQPDAHLVKYTLACLDAAANDRAHARLFLTAAASLVGWWSRVATPA
jgi:hypothetical protein